MRAPALTVLAILAVAGSARAQCPGALATRIVPLPVWATDPNEGNTWGAMPVFVRVCTETNRTEWILAPSVTWNSIIELSATLRFYDYINPDTTLSVTASASTHINYNLFVVWEQLPRAVSAFTNEAT